MASYPTFNPNRLTTLNGPKFVKIDNAAAAGTRPQPLLNRAINETYPPGSSFKIDDQLGRVLDRQGREPEHAPSPRRSR